MRRMGVKHRASTPYHAQTDGATERLNQILEGMLRAYTSPRQDDWARFLYLCEVAYNSGKNVSTTFAPYELLYSQPQDILTRILHPKDDSLNQLDEDMEKWWEKVRMRILEAKECIRRSAVAQKKYYDNRHSPLPRYKAGDFVSLRLDLHPSEAIRHNKLSARKLTPFKIVEVLSRGRAVRLDLPSHIRIHSVLSVQHVEPVPNPASDPHERDYNHLPAVDEGGEYYAGEVIDKRVTPTGRVKYRVRWIGYPLAETTWLDKKHVGEDLIKEFEERQAARRGAISWSSVMTEGSGAPPFKYTAIIPPKGTKLERPVGYIARVTKPYERHYESTERELACAVWAFNKWRFIIEGGQTMLVTDHASIREVLQSATTVQYSLRIDKFRNLLTPYIDDITIVYRPGKLHLNVDALSRARWVGTRLNMPTGTLAEDTSGAGLEMVGS